MNVTRHAILGAALLLPAAISKAQAPDAASPTPLLRQLDVAGGIPVRVAIQESVRGIVAATSAGLILELRRHSVRGRDYRLLVVGADGETAHAKPGPVRTVRGKVSGIDASSVAGGLLEDGLHARIGFGGTEYFLQPVPGQAGEKGGMHLLYRGADVRHRRRSCDTTDAHRRAGALAPLRVAESGVQGPAAVQVAELACDADFEYFSTYGSASAVGSRIETVINTVNVQYERDLDVTHSITTILVRTSSSQPYTSTNANTLLDQFRNTWNANHGSVQRDTAHLFTGKEIDGTTIGIAYVGVICNQSFGYGLVQSDFDNSFACVTDLSAHELGHNWNANHCSCSGYTMNSFITCANRFHPRQSVKEMRRFRNQIGCLDSGGGGNPTSVHVDSISVSTPGAGRGQKRGRAVVVIRDDVGNPVSGATVNGTFSGTFNETASGVTGSDGSVTLNTSGSIKGKPSVTFCVTSVSASLPYNASDNNETCDNN